MINLNDYEHEYDVMDYTTTIRNKKDKSIVGYVRHKGVWKV